MVYNFLFSSSLSGRLSVWSTRRGSSVPSSSLVLLPKSSKRRHWHLRTRLFCSLSSYYVWSHPWRWFCSNISRRNWYCKYEASERKDKHLCRQPRGGRYHSWTTEEVGKSSRWFCCCNQRQGPTAMAERMPSAWCVVLSSYGLRGMSQIWIPLTTLFSYPEWPTQCASSWTDQSFGCCEPHSC